MLSRTLFLMYTIVAVHLAEANQSCAGLFSDIGRLDQQHPQFAKIGLVDTCTGRSNLCAPVSAINGLPRVIDRSINEAEAIQLVDNLVRGSGIDLASVLSRGFWPFEIKQALDRFFEGQNIRAEIRATGVHAFADNWDPSVFAANTVIRQLPDLVELFNFLSRPDAFTMVNFLGFADHQYATTAFDPTRALEDFQHGRIFMAHYLTIDKVLEKRPDSISVLAQDPMNGSVEFEMIPFEHPIFGSRIYRIKFLKPLSEHTFLVSALLQVNKNWNAPRRSGSPAP